MCINVSYPIPSIGRYQINGGGGGSVVNALALFVQSSAVVFSCLTLLEIA